MAEERLVPIWVDDLERLLPIRAQFVLSGNVRDSFIGRDAGQHVLCPLVRCLWFAIQPQPMGFEFMLVFDPIDGIRPYPDTKALRLRASKLFEKGDDEELGLAWKNGYQAVSLAKLPAYLRKAVSLTEARVAFVVDYASRLCPNPQDPQPDRAAFFAACEKLSHSAKPISGQVGKGGALFNPIVWLVNREGDLPAWLAMDNERIHRVVIPKPSHAQRQAAATTEAVQFAKYEDASPAKRAEFAKTFADLTEGMTLRSIIDISSLARYRGLELTKIEDAVRCFKIGLTDSPWKSKRLKESIADADARIRKKVKGQTDAVKQTLDILKRSVQGLSGAQAGSSPGRPRGVLFFAGPTGVGKTELAKAITEVLFGDINEYVRFDMSEFSAEHSDARLLGAPPGFIGYEGGGELTNAIRAKPCSVILFDEIEKAHPRILDKFLQILEDGRITGGRGDTVYFSEAVIVFTSNLGIFRREVSEKTGVAEWVRAVNYGKDYQVVKKAVEEGIKHHFTAELQRPELLNRLGQNIVVFHFIMPEAAKEIFEQKLSYVVARVREQLAIDLFVSDAAQETLYKECTKNLEDGGRGIGNELEKIFVNPLARELFQMSLENRRRVEVTEIHSTHADDWSVVLK